MGHRTVRLPQFRLRREPLPLHRRYADAARRLYGLSREAAGGPLGAGEMVLVAFVLGISHRATTRAERLSEAPASFARDTGLLRWLQSQHGKRDVKRTHLSFSLVPILVFAT